MNRDEIIKQGYVDVKIQVTGMRQAHRLKVTIEKSQKGAIAYLTSEKSLPAPELIRLSEELQFPIRCRGTIYFPKGKSPADFAERDKSIADVEETVIEAEIED